MKNDTQDIIISSDIKSISSSDVPITYYGDTTFEKNLTVKGILKVEGKDDQKKIGLNDIFHCILKDKEGNYSSGRIIELFCALMAGAIGILWVIQSWVAPATNPNYLSIIITFFSVATGLKVTDRLTNQ